YHDGECQRKWLSMRSNGVTLGTLVQMARDRGWVPEDDPDGKAARTHFAVEATATIATPEGPRTVSRLRLRLDTGRTHQIRIHLALTGHPLLGDDTYGAGPFAYLSATGEARVLIRPALHSARIAFAHPITGEALEITSPLPEDLAALFPGC
ncbi:MAG: PriCT-2 domain-containing protein, partial [Eggerthellaceae bacterium]|nr:PriCT-2 domain-containing protein [Eggerthellaceae bacterium]